VTSGGRVYLALRGLPAPPPGKVYQAWTLRRGAKAVAPSITFNPDPSGITLVELPEPASNLAAVALSVEPAGGSEAPTSTPAFVRPLT
jgi:anti-sigma-K factor RskA